MHNFSDEVVVEDEEDCAATLSCDYSSATAVSIGVTVAASVFMLLF